MRRILPALAVSALLAACVSTRPARAPAPWDLRLAQLQRADAWQLDGRAAVAVGTQGWQASLDWKESGGLAEVRLAGPLGVGALVVKETADGVSLNGAPPSGTVLDQLQARLGFDLPLGELRFWLLGVPDPRTSFDVTPNDQGRALELKQAGWTLDYDRYMPVGGDVLPARMVLSREGVRVRIAVDHWDGPR